MTEGTAPLPFFASDIPLDITSSEFSFTIVAYVPNPVLIERDSDLKAALEKRQADDDGYRRSVSPTSWHRFTSLGFQAMSGQEFDTIWRQRNSDPLCFHRLVWFNYKSYVDRELNVSPKLYAWANKVSQPFLLEHSPESLEMDTERFNWPHIIAYFAKHLDKGLWKAVKGVHKRNAKMPPMTTPNCPIAEEEVGLPSKTTRFSIPDSEVMTGSKCDSPRSDPEEASTSLRNTTFDVDGESNSESDAKQSAFTLSNEVTTNDGAHRISFKWKLVQKEFNDLADNKQRLLSEIHAMLSITFLEADGCFYMWDSTELAHPKRVHELTVSDLDEYLEPQITKVHTMQLIVFAVRFAFSENPISWRNSTHVQSAMKLNNLKIHESNVTPKAGIPIVAGYILLKHPTMTLRHKYTQFLRSRMVDTQPYFDIRLHRKTPTDKSIAHLVVYCGEKQVTELCQGLSKILNGHQTAVFLPRYTFANMSTDQIDNHFQMHEKYIRALRPISLAPLVTTLDLKRIEYFSDGTTIERSTRDWVLSLRRVDGETHAQCDVVNGIKNSKTAYVMAPAAYATEIKSMVMQYKERLRPISHREEKYREGIPDLPDVIHITSTVQTNLDFMAKLSSVDIWSKAPPSVKSPSVVESAGKETSSVKPQDTVIRDNSLQWPSLVKRPPGDKDYSIEAARMPGTTALPKGQPNPKSQTKGKSSQISSLTLLDEIDERADTASTHSLTNTLRSSTTTRMTELENQMRECRELLRSNREATQDSSDRLAANEQSLRETMETITEMTHTVAGLQTQFASFNITMESMRLMLHTLMHQTSFTTAASGVLPFAGVQQSIQIPLSHMALQIPEVDGTTVPGTDDSQSIVSGDGSSRYRRSPEKKKTRKNEEQQNSRAETSPIALDDVQMQLFDDELPPNDEDTTTGAHDDSVTDHRPEDTNSQLPLSTTHQNPSPPDAQYTNSSDPAGRDAT